MKMKIEKYNFQLNFVNFLQKNIEKKKKRFQKEVNNIFSKYKINFCYLFGSYAKNKAKPSSDVDLLIDSDVTGLDFFGLVEELRQKLHKRIDLLKLEQLGNNEDLLREIMKDGIRIYG